MTPEIGCSNISRGLKKIQKDIDKIGQQNDLITQERLRLCEKSYNEKKYLNR